MWQLIKKFWQCPHWPWNLEVVYSCKGTGRLGVQCKKCHFIWIDKKPAASLILEELEHAERVYKSLWTKFKKIEDYTDEELAATIKYLGVELPKAYQYLNFIDAYFEQRKRKLLSSK